MSASAPIFSDGKWMRTRDGEGRNELDRVGTRYREYSLNGIDWVTLQSWRLTRQRLKDASPA